MVLLCVNFGCGVDMSDLVKSTLIEGRKSFALALGGNQEIADKYILGVYNTVILNDKLMECSPASIRDAAITSAVLGVPIDARHYAYLIPYNSKAQFQMSYKGYVHVAKRDPDVDNIWSNIVYEDDAFSIDIGDNKLSHVPNLESDKYGLVAHIKYIYAVVRFKTNTGRSHMFEVMTLKQIKEIRAISKSGGEKDKYGKPTIWESNFSEMGRKTVIKRLCKHAQLGDVSRVDEIDNSLENGKIINVTPQGELKVDDSLRENRDKILSLISETESQEELDKVFQDNREKIEELINSSLSAEISKASKEKKDELYGDKIMSYLGDCEDISSLDRVYNNHKVGIDQLKAALRNEVTQYYTDLKQTLTDMAA